MKILLALAARAHVLVAWTFAVLLAAGPAGVWRVPLRELNRKYHAEYGNGMPGDCVLIGLGGRFDEDLEGFGEVRGDEMSELEIVLGGRGLCR